MGVGAEVGWGFSSLLQCISTARKVPVCTQVNVAGSLSSHQSRPPSDEWRIDRRVVRAQSRGNNGRIDRRFVASLSVQHWHPRLMCTHDPAARAIGFSFLLSRQRLSGLSLDLLSYSTPPPGANGAAFVMVPCKLERKYREERERERNSRCAFVQCPDRNPYEGLGASTMIQGGGGQFLVLVSNRARLPDTQQ